TTRLLFDHRHARSLRPLRSLLLGEAHAMPHLHPVEARLEHAVAMEVHLASVGGRDEAVAPVREQLRDRALGRPLLVTLGVAPLAMGEVLELASRGVEGVA